MGKTNIEWTDESINPIRARHRESGSIGHYCELVSPGCAHCYASTLQKRFNMPPFGKQNQYDIEPFLDVSKLHEVLRRKKPTKFFWEDMSDLFGRWVYGEWMDKCFATMALSERHTHQVLTKRPERMRDFLRVIHADYGRLESAARSLGYSLRFHDMPLVRWPIPSVWLGVSVEDRKHGLPRIDVLREIPAVVRFLSIEPLLEDLGELDLSEISWVIVGGESGHGARPCHPDWVRSIKDQCKSAGVPFFFKQWGEWAPYGWSGLANVWTKTHERDGKTYGRLFARDCSAGRYEEIPLFKGKSFETRFIEPNYECVAKVGKKAAGRLLDGQEYSEFPTGAK